MSAAGALAAGGPVREALGTGAPEAWVALDAAVRGPGAYGVVPGRAELWAADGTGPGGESWLALALCHADGRVREVAVRRAAGRPELLPLLVLRAADWAGPVREAARDVLRDRLGPDTAVALAPLVVRVARQERGAYALDLLTGVLRRAGRDALGALLAGDDRDARRLAYRLAVTDGLFTPADLARAADDPDVVVRRLGTEAALAAVRNGGAYDDVLGALLGARDPGVRAAGVTALRAAGRAGEATAFLTDRAAGVRACARYVVRAAGADPLAWYRRRCADVREPLLPPGAVAGLAECGERAVDADTLRALLTHPAPGVRARAVDGLRVLDVTDVPLLWPLLDDPAPAVTRRVAEALAPSARLLDAAGLTERLAPGRPRHVRLAAVRLLGAYGGVAGLRALVGVLDDPDEALRRRAEERVRRWRVTADVRRGVVAGPDAAAEAVEVAALLERIGPVAGADGVRRLRWEAGLPAR
ncbi:hypothetical protein ACIQPQ_03755 [Streptomyces sp. NPDC091281]|uniref:hypothetical protein n=1 Tax=Streptomyces sp. NPDC091281 TaxID=3365985 RepID=UPI003824B19E